MIGSLNGRLALKSPPDVLIECAGVGYEVAVSMTTFYQLPAVGEPVRLLTHMVVREDAQLLYGFAAAPEREAFRQLLRISGVGPRIALSLLSGLSVDDLTRAVATQDVSRLVKVPGVGKKTAERLLLELKGKLGDAIAGAGAAPMNDTQSDITQALLALGYNERDAAAALRQLPPDVSVTDGIKGALKALAR